MKKIMRGKLAISKTQTKQQTRGEETMDRLYESETPNLNCDSFVANIQEEVITCSRCGCIIEPESVIRIDGEPYCDDCVRPCDHCGELHSLSDMDEVAAYWHRENWCSDCIDNDAIACDDCGRYVSVNTARRVIGGSYVCPDCYENEYSYCSVCDEAVPNDDYDFDLDMCGSCARDRGGIIAQYHDAPPLKFFGKCKASWGGLMRGLGVELEVDRSCGYTSPADSALAISEIAGEHVYFEHDGSLSDEGFEIITQPHTEEAFWQMPWDEILDSCKSNGYSSHDIGTCGLHVHLSRNLFGSTYDAQDRAIGKLMYFYASFYTDVLLVARRTREQADSWARNYAIHSIDDAKRFGKSRGEGRYYAVNNSNRNTVEIRIMRGTLKLSTFNACIDFVLTTAKNSRRIRWDDINNAKCWLKGLKPETVEYLKSRHAFEGNLPDTHTTSHYACYQEEYTESEDM